ncbi:MAG TPA: thioesterase family protein [Planctomycetota bacterium]|nr:thioesterase family protein [Planctomycetota bacterium]
MSKPSVVEVEARSYELDPYGHLNNAVYVNWLEHGRLSYLRDRGHSYTSVPETFGVHVVVVRQDLQYKAQVRLGDRLLVTSRVVRLGRTSFTFFQEIAYPGGPVAATGEVTMVSVGPDGAATPVPPGLRNLLES